MQEFYDEDSEDIDDCIDDLYVNDHEYDDYTPLPPLEDDEIFWNNPDLGLNDSDEIVRKIGYKLKKVIFLAFLFLNNYLFHFNK